LVFVEKKIVREDDGVGDPIRGKKKTATVRDVVTGEGKKVQPASSA